MRVAADVDELERQHQHVLANHSGPIILTGDININLASGGDSTAARRLRELLDAYSLEQHVRGPTYEPSGSAIDICCDARHQISFPLEALPAFGSPDEIRKQYS